MIYFLNITFNTEFVISSHFKDCKCNIKAEEKSVTIKSTLGTLVSNLSIFLSLLGLLYAADFVFAIL